MNCRTAISLRALGPLALILGLSISPLTTSAMLIVDATVTPSGGFFDYQLTVTNGLADDVILISLLDAPLGDGSISGSLTAPAGFAANYDPGLGTVDLLEDTSLFGAGTVVSGYAFTSASAPGSGVFENFQAFTVFLDQVNGTVQTTLVPEPNTALLLGLGLAGLFAAGRARRFRRTLGVALPACLLVTGVARAASHSDAPLIKQDPQANITDVYTFVGPKFNDPDTKVLNVVTQVRPFSEPGDGPHYDRFADDAQYSIHLTDPFSGETVLRYNFEFSSVNPVQTPGLKNPNTLLSYGNGTELGAIQTLGDARQNYAQTYSIKRVFGGTQSSVAANLPTAIPNVGPRTTPAYNDTAGRAISGATTEAQLDAYTRDAIADLPSGEVVFAGSRDDGFYADIGGVFDLLDSRILDNNGDTSDGLGQDGNGVDTFKGYNVLTYAIQVPVDDLAVVPGFPLVGVYSSVSRPRITLRRTNGDPRNLGPFVQVNRMGNPLFNEMFVPLKDKDTYNRTSPTEDSTRFADYAGSPEITRLINSVFGTNFPEDSAFLRSIYTPDLLRVDLSTPPVPLAGDPDFNRLSFLGEDLVPSQLFGSVESGWPNGRRFGDDVVDIALTIASGTFTSGGPKVGDNVPANDAAYNRVFPYAATPHSGTNNRKDPVVPGP